MGFSPKTIKFSQPERTKLVKCIKLTKSEFGVKMPQTHKNSDFWTLLNDIRGKNLKGQKIKQMWKKKKTIPKNVFLLLQ